ncbi:MAG TPA: hypothetical protein VGC27_00370 [Rhizomicrobium sp.]
MNELLTRRNILIGAGGAVALSAVALEGRRLLRKRYAPSPYDDLLTLLDDRDADAQIGEAVLADLDDFDARIVADDLRERIGDRPLAQVMAEDVAEGRTLEANGWVIPETLALLCALAAKAAA